MSILILNYNKIFLYFYINYVISNKERRLFMSLVKAKEYLKKFGLDKNVIEFSKSTAPVKEAAEALNCEDA